MEIFLLGGFRVKVGGTLVEEECWVRRSAKSLVKMLALKPQHRLHREQVMDLLWAEQDIETAVNSLNKAIYMARRAFEPDLKKGSNSQFILTQKQQITLTAPGSFYIDLDEFERLASAAVRNGDIEAGKKAIELYSGDLLIEDIYEDWIFAHRESLRILFRKAATKTAELYAEAGERQTGIEILKKLASEDTSDEFVHRQLMRLYMETGSKYQALKQFEQCRAALVALGLEPEQETIKLEQDIKKGLVIPSTNGFELARQKSSVINIESPRVRQLTFQRGGIQTAKFAPDNQTIVYSAAWEGGATELYTANRQSGESRRLLFSDAGVFSISPDGDMAIALSRKFLRGYTSVGTLTRTPLVGGTASPLIENVQWADWNPVKKISAALSGDSSIAVVRDNGGKNCLEYPIGNVIYKTGGWVSHPRFSPDGKKIAFIEHPTVGDDGGFVAVIDLMGSKEKRVLTGEWISVQGLAWANEGEIWFTAAGEGNARAIRAVNLKGEQRLIYSGIGSLTLRDVSTSGEALITVEKTRIQIAARRSGDAEARDLSWHDWTLARDLSEDGETLLFTEAGESGGSLYASYVRKTDGSSAAKIGSGSALALSPDGKYALVRIHKPHQQLALLPIGEGETKLLKTDSLNLLNYQPWACFFPDGERILFAANEKDRGTRLYIQDIDGAPVCLTPNQEGAELTSPHSIAPDGKLIAYVNSENRLCLYEIKTRKSIPFKILEKNFLLVRWSGDSSHLFIRHRSQVPALLYKYDLNSGEKEQLFELMPKDQTGVHEILRVLLTPDGSSYAYSYTRELSDLYIVEGLM